MWTRAQAELRQLWEQTRDKVRAYMFCACSDWNDADDLAQECYLRALRNWDLFDGRGSRQAWLFVIARNTHIDWLRRQTTRRKIRATEGEVGVRTTPTTYERDEIEMLWEAVNALHRDHREVIHLRFAAGLSYAEMAEALNVPVGTVRSRLHRGLKMLRRGVLQNGD